MMPPNYERDDGGKWMRNRLEELEKQLREVDERLVTMYREKEMVKWLPLSSEVEILMARQQLIMNDVTTIKARLGDYVVDEVYIEEEEGEDADGEG